MPVPDVSINYISLGRVKYCKSVINASKTYQNESTRKGRTILFTPNISRPVGDYFLLVDYHTSRLYRLVDGSISTDLLRILIVFSASYNGLPLRNAISFCRPMHAFRIFVMPSFECTALCIDVMARFQFGPEDVPVLMHAQKTVAVLTIKLGVFCAPNLTASSLLISHEGSQSPKATIHQAEKYHTT